MDKKSPLPWRVDDACDPEFTVIYDGDGLFVGKTVVAADAEAIVEAMNASHAPVAVPRGRGAAATYPAAFESFWSLLREAGGLGNSLKGDAATAWANIGKPTAPSEVKLIINRWRQYLASIPPALSPKHVGRWLKARGWEQEYQPWKPPASRDYSNWESRGQMRPVTSPSPYCAFHESNRNRDKAAPAFVPGCPECKHVRSFRAQREGEPEDMGSILATMDSMGKAR